MAKRNNNENQIYGNHTEETKLRPNEKIGPIFPANRKEIMTIIMMMMMIHPQKKKGTQVSSGILIIDLRTFLCFIYKYLKKKILNKTKIEGYNFFILKITMSFTNKLTSDYLLYRSIQHYRSMPRIFWLLRYRFFF